MMCCGHDDGGHDSHRMEERVYEPMAATSATAPCPECGYPAQEDFVVCPHCGTELLTACPECHRAVKTGWVRCAYCGADLAGK